MKRLLKFWFGGGVFVALLYFVLAPPSLFKAKAKADVDIDWSEGEASRL